MTEILFGVNGVWPYGLIICTILAFIGGLVHNIIWLRKPANKKLEYRFIKKYYAVICALWILNYIYVLLAKVGILPTADPVWFGITVVRPIALLTGIGFLISGIARNKGREDPKGIEPVTREDC